MARADGGASGGAVPNSGLQVHSALQLVMHDKQVTIVRVKCGFASTEAEAATRGGYRDLQLLVRCNGFDFNDFNDIGVNCTNLRFSLPFSFPFKPVPFIRGLWGEGGI